MPAVGMRRSTRVFGARVLRSGRRLSTAEAGEGWKQQHQTRSAANLGEEFIDIIDRNFVESKRLCKGTDKRPDGVLSLNEETQQMGTNKKIVDHSNGRRWGIVYQRKRKRLDAKDVDSVISSDRRYGIQFSRQRVKRLRGSQAICQLQIIRGGGGDMIFSVFLNSILSYMSRVGVTLQQLSEFLLSYPICIVYSMHDIHFLQNSTSNTSSGVCRIMGSRSSVPMFTLNYSAVPSVFMLLHTSLLLRSATFPKSNGVKVDADSIIGDEEMISCNISEFGNSGGGTPVSIISSSVKRSVPWGAATPKTTARILQLRTVNSRGVQKRRSSLRLRRGRNLSSFVGRKVAGVPPHTAMSFTNDGLLSVVKSSQEIISPMGESFKRNFKEFKPPMDASAEILDASSCYANLLVIEADKCYREQDAMVTLEYSASNKWFVRIRTYGAWEYNFKAEKVMRPSTFNRVTKAIVWTTDNGWKLEFCNKSDWLIFKRLYKECFERNVEAPSGSGIPVPCVVEVCPDDQNNILPFERPESYIEWKDDELTRALREGATNYDMDSEDEIWLNKFNIENDFDKPISAETFELIISSFEKGVFCIQDDYLDVEAAVSLCISLERREVLEAVHSYWIKKRKQKRSSLVRVFQCYQPRRAEALTKAVLRKRRSFSRQASKTGRGKQRTLLQAMAAERNTIDEQKIILKVQEANAATYRSEDVAIHKRKRAQMLIDVADKYTYKAAMALRISEAIKQKKSLIDFAKFFLV